MNFGDDWTTDVGLEGGPRYTVARDGNMLSVAEIGRPENRVAFDLGALAESLREIDLNYNDPKSTKAMTLEATENGLRARLYVEHMNGRRNGFDANEIDYGAGMLLIGRAE